MGDAGNDRPSRNSYDDNSSLKKLFNESSLYNEENLNYLNDFTKEYSYFDERLLIPKKERFSSPRSLTVPQSKKKLSKTTQKTLSLSSSHPIESPQSKQKLADSAQKRFEQFDIRFSLDEAIKSSKQGDIFRFGREFLDDIHTMLGHISEQLFSAQRDSASTVAKLKAHIDQMNSSHREVEYFGYDAIGIASYTPPSYDSSFTGFFQSKWDIIKHAAQVAWSRFQIWHKGLTPDLIAERQIDNFKPVHETSKFAFERATQHIDQCGEIETVLGKIDKKLRDFISALETEIKDNPNNLSTEVLNDLGHPLQNAIELLTIIGMNLASVNQHANALRDFGKFASGTQIANAASVLQTTVHSLVRARDAFKEFGHLPQDVIEQSIEEMRSYMGSLSAKLETIEGQFTIVAVGSNDNAKESPLLQIEHQPTIPLDLNTGNQQQAQHARLGGNSQTG